MADSDRPRKRFLAVRFRPTVAGWLFFALTVLLAVAAVKSQISLMFVLFGVMMGALMVSVTLARRSVASVSVRRDVPSRAWQHQAVHPRSD